MAKKQMTFEDACKEWNLDTESAVSFLESQKYPLQEEGILNDKTLKVLSALGEYLKNSKRDFTSNDAKRVEALEGEVASRGISESAPLTDEETKLEENAMESESPVDVLAWLDRLERINKDLNGQKNEISSLNETAKSKVNEFNEKLSELEQDRKNLKEERKVTERLQVELQNQNMALQAEKSKYEEDSRRLASEYKSKGDALEEELRNEFSQKEANLEAEYVKKEADLAKDRQYIEAEFDKLDKKEKELKPVYDYLHGLGINIDINEIESAKTQYIEVMSRLGGALKAATEGANKASEDYISELMESLSSYHEKVNLFKDQLKDIFDAKVEQIKKESDLQDEKEECVALKESLKAKIERADARAVRIKGEEFSKRITELETEVDRVRAEAHANERKYSQAKDKLNVICSAFGEISPEEYASEYLKMKRERDRYQSEMTQMVPRTQLDDKEKELKVKTSACEELSKQLQEARTEKYVDILVNANGNALKVKELESQLNHYKHLYETQSEIIQALRGEEGNKREAFPYVNKNIGIQPIIESFNDNEVVGLKDFLSYVQGRMAFNGFDYSEKTLRVFLAGLHMSPLTILQGLSGTGKTSLPKEFIKAMYSRISDDEDLPYRVCPIQSGWRDNMDLLGFYNSFDHKYKETEFFKALFIAGQPRYRNTLFFIIMDEMNLSHPEHYFADFLSAIELKEGDNKASNNEGHTQTVEINAPADVRIVNFLDSGLEIPNNVRFIGTANEDETTNAFAPKTLDRANVMNFTGFDDELDIDQAEENKCFSYEWLDREFSKADGNHKAEIDKFENFITDPKLKELLSNNKIGIGYRFIKRQAPRFINAFLSLGGSLADAVDHLMASRILSVFGKRYGLEEKTINTFMNEYFTIYLKDIYNRDISQDDNKDDVIKKNCKETYAYEFFEQLKNNVKNGNN